MDLLTIEAPKQVYDKKIFYLRKISYPIRVTSLLPICFFCKNEESFTKINLYGKNNIICKNYQINIEVAV